MTRPSFSARLAGHPLVATVLFALYGAMVFGWLKGSVSGWLVAVASLVALRTLAAVRLKRAYKAWRAEWDYINGNEAPTKKKSGRGLIVFAALYVVALPMMPRLVNDNLKVALVVLWGLACLYLAFAFVRGIVRRISKRREATAAVAVVKAKDEPVVTLLLGRPASSPTREDAEHELPDYCFRLNKVGQSRRILRAV